MGNFIFKVNYYTNHSRSVGGMLEYIGTREGVEKLPRSGMLSYIAKRPMVEVLGSHGLFSKTDEPVHLYKEKETIDRFPGNIYSAVVSLLREDAERLGFDSAAAWMPVIRAQMVHVAQQMKLPESDLNWFAAYHDHPDHPHCHILLYSPSQKGWLSKKGIETIRGGFARELFAQDHMQLYAEKTRLRNDLKTYTRERMKAAAQRRPTSSPEIEARLLTLSRQLKKHKGKPLYGYLKANLKAEVNSIFRLLAQDADITELYKG